ncbi:DUF4064 domain-containing protein [Pseudalkalibacillus decolorationis]|uniref:DUF4064 domain-containing protein n=1 Tax=Pseudalkalibacillus decolorationis TaxID=163879 RepID=UPI002147B1E1|nr:DUF4064 domain-containing protein [Pseudalkalibacillus decolorationis]
MKRTSEIVLTVIGMLINVIMALGVGAAIVIFQNESIQQELEREIANDPQLNEVDPSMIFDIIGTFGWAVVIALAIGFILGLIATFGLKGNKKPKQAGILLIIGGIIVGIATIGSGFGPAILYLIAGIMALVRKPKEEQFNQ